MREISQAGLLIVVFAFGGMVHALGQAGTAMAQGRTQGKRVISPATSPKTGLPYSPGILVGNTLYVSGHLGRDPKTAALVPGGIETETRQSIANIREVLKAAGMDLRDVVSVTAFIRDFKDFDAFNRVYREYFTADLPARATVGVASLNAGAVIELQMVAVKP